jgi:hypothetical protein
MGHTRQVGLFLTLVLSAASGWAAATPVVPLRTSATFTARQPERRWSVPIRASDGHVAYILSLEPDFDVGGHVVTVELVLRRAAAKDDAPDLLRGNLHGLQPPDFAANDLAHGVKDSVYGEKRTMSLTKLRLLLRVVVTDATVSPNPTIGGYQLDRLTLHIEVDNL